jgi:hypothetical protein
MKTFKLQEDESLIDSFELDICIIKDKLKGIIERSQLLDIFWESPWLTEWNHINLYFTSKRIELLSSGEQISISYKDVKNINISNLRCRPPKTGLYIGLSAFIGLGGMIGSALIGGSITNLGFVILGIGTVIMLYNLIFRWVMTYNIYLGEQIEFSIKKDDEIIDRIKDAYEKGKHYNNKKDVN